MHLAFFFSLVFYNSNIFKKQKFTKSFLTSIFLMPVELSIICYIYDSTQMSIQWSAISIKPMENLDFDIMLSIGINNMVMGLTT